jgi:hypothetical protein
MNCLQSSAEFNYDSLIGSRTDVLIQFMPKTSEYRRSPPSSPSTRGRSRGCGAGEYRGKQTLSKQQSPQVLEALRENAVIQSTESSNRIEASSRRESASGTSSRTAPRQRAVPSRKSPATAKS